MASIAKLLVFAAWALSSLQIHALTYSSAEIDWSAMYFVYRDSASTIGFDIIDETRPEPFYAYLDGARRTESHARSGDAATRYAETDIDETLNRSYVSTTTNFIKASTFNHGRITVDGTDDIEVHVPYRLERFDSSAGFTSSVHVEIYNDRFDLSDIARLGSNGSRSGELVLTIPKTGMGQSYHFRGFTVSGATPMPEPESLAILGVGLAGLCAVHRSRIMRRRSR